MIPDITELNFPKKDGKQYATLTQATANIADMGEKSITTQVKIDGDIVPDFSFDWEVEFQGEKYIMPLRIPQGAKENTSLNSTIDLTFQHWAIYQLKRWPFVTIQQIAAGTYLPDEEVAPVQLNLKDFCILCGQVLEYYYGGAITIDFNDDPVTGWQYKQEATRIEISHTKIWNVLIDAFHDKYGVRWEIKAASDNSNTIKGGERYVIRVGYPTTEVDHIFEYGFDGGLLKIERQVQSEEIRNMLKGRGGETNIPFRYFKDTDPNNKDFRPDPDWVEELANIPFTNLMPATFRSYVQGWKAAHIAKYPGYTAVGESNAYAPWAYRKGYTDTKFHPVEFVADEISDVSELSEESDGSDRRVEILPGYAPYIKKGSSIDKYGPLPDTLDNNDDIYPTLQGTGLDVAVAVEQIESDDVAGATENDAQIEDKTYPDIVKRSVPQGHATAADASKRTYFTVPTGKKANIEGYAGAKAYNPKNHEDKSGLIAELDYTIKVFNAVTGAEHPASGIPAGDWYFTVEYSFNNTGSDALNVTLSFNSVKITSATPDDKWCKTFDIWVKNIWNSSKLSTETDAQYAERVWKPVLGDREKNTAKVVFTSGALVHEDYEFTIVGFPVPDTSKTWQEKNDSGVVIGTHTSHWRITLAKSDAELEATGLYVPSTKQQGKAGDRFVFIGTEMTHVPYVVDAEIRLDNWKKDQLGEKKEIKPTAVVTTDRVRLSNEGKPDALINQLRVGNSLRLFDKRFFNEPGKAYETLYLQSITYTYREPSSNDAALNPDVEIVLGNEYATSANPVSMMQGKISALQKQVGSISNIQQIVRAVGDKLYLRKDGISDRSLSPTQFFSLLTSGDFRAGLIGGAGWGFYKDENGNWVLEADRVNVRQEMQVNTLVINQAEGRGGMEIDTAAYIEGVTRVVETSDGYICYFDQKSGSVANLFHVDDVAFCNRWTAENADLKFYKRRVTAVSADSITLSKTDVNGTGIPAEGDNIIHFGNYTDATRQYVKVRDVVGGGYERHIENLDSVNAEGVEYFFVGKQAGQSRWFVGNKDLVPYSGDGEGSYIEYINRKFNLHNVSLSVGSTIGDKTIDEYFADKAEAATDKYKYLAVALPQDTEITGGVMLSTLVSLGYTDSASVRHTLAGMNGAYVPSLGGRTIGSWWGGEMLDLFKADDTRKTLAELIAESGKNNPEAATSLVRMDGSAYFLGGDVQFRSDKTAVFGSGDTAITIADGRVKLGNGILIDIGGEAQGLGNSIASVATLANELSNLFTPYNGTTELTWQEVIDGEAYDSIKANRSFWTEYSFAGKGMTPAAGSTGGGGGSLFGLYTDTTWVSVPAESDALSAVLGKSLHARVSVLEGAGYLTAITKAMVENVLTGDITTHTHSQYLTQHQSLADYYTKSQADTRYARQAAPNNFMHSGNEMTFVPSGYSAPIWFNYRTVGGTNGAITEYRFGNGSGGAYADVRAKSFIVNGGTAAQFLMADGSVTTKVTAEAPASCGTDALQIPSMRFLAYWNGTFNPNGASNLTYCSKGKFGTMAVANAADYLARSGGSMTNTNLVNNLNANYLGGYTQEQIRRNALGFTPTVVPTSSGNCDLDLLKDGMARNDWAPEKWVHAPEDFGYGAAVVFAPFGYTNLHGQLAWDVNHAQDNVTRNLYWRVFATATGGTDKWGGWRQFAFTDLGYGMQETTIDATGLDENTYYPVTFAIGSRNTVRIEFLTGLDSYTKPAWSTHPSGYSVRLIVEVNGFGWGTSNLNTTVYEADYIWASAPPVAGLGQMTNSSTEYVYVRGGGRYRIRTSHGIVPVLRTSSYTISSQTITPTTTVPAEIKRTNALITDNVASATKLQTARSIWGQNFDGTSAITGNMIHVGEFRFEAGTAVLHNATTKVYQLWAVNGINLFPTWSVNTAVLSVTPNGNVGRVGVNMFSPAYDFDVTGVIHASGEIFSDKAIGGKGMTSSSDIRQKHIIGDFVMSLDDVLKMPLKRFKWLDGPDKDERIGVIAQEALKIVPQVVYLKPDGFYGVDYGALAHAEAKTAVRELVEQRTIIAKQGRQIKRLEKLVQKLQQKIHA